MIPVFSVMIQLHSRWAIFQHIDTVQLKTPCKMTITMDRREPKCLF